MEVEPAPAQRLQRAILTHLVEGPLQGLHLGRLRRQVEGEVVLLAVVIDEERGERLEAVAQLVHVKGGPRSSAVTRSTLPRSSMRNLSSSLLTLTGASPWRINCWAEAELRTTAIR